MSRAAPDRQDAALKVRGQAVYAAEHRVPNLAHAILVQSTIAKGRVLEIDTTAALSTPGVLRVITHDAMPQTKPPAALVPGGMAEKRAALQDGLIHHDGQHIALVIADSLEAAQEGARQVSVRYAVESHRVTIEDAHDIVRPASFFGVYPMQYHRGDAASIFAEPGAAVDEIYSTPIEHHHPMEPHATIATWEAEHLTLYDATQGVCGTRDAIAAALELPKDHVRVVAPFLGGGFGCKGFVWPHVLLTAIAARELGRPVKLVLRRDQMFTSNGHRAATIQAVALAANADGRLLATRQQVRSHTSTVGDFAEPAGCQAPLMYASPAVDLAHSVARLDLATPTAMRAPGKAPGSFALECAMDELACRLGIDPVDLRVRNHADCDAVKNKPWSSNHLLECYRRGAARFGWDRRRAAPGLDRRGRWLVGLGMATAAYPANRNAASAKVSLHADGTAEVCCAAQDLGTGAYTVMSQVAAEVLGLPIAQISSRLGDSALPPAPLGGGSRTTASIGPAIRAAAENLLQKLLGVATSDARSPLHGVPANGLRIEAGHVVVISQPDRRVALAEVVRHAGGTAIDGEASIDPAGTDAVDPARPVRLTNGKPDEPFSWYSFGAHFVEVHVDAELGEVRVPRVVSVIDAGRIVSRKTAESQIRGGVIWGIGMALMEKTVVDVRSGRIITRSLADCLVPTHADVGELEVEFVDHPDLHFNSLGARGLGEIGIVGVAAAIANAVYNATGKRIRELPIDPASLIAPAADRGADGSAP